MRFSAAGETIGFSNVDLPVALWKALCSCWSQSSKGRLLCASSKGDRGGEEKMASAISPCPRVTHIWTLWTRSRPPLVGSTEGRGACPLWSGPPTWGPEANSPWRHIGDGNKWGVYLETFSMAVSVLRAQEGQSGPCQMWGRRAFLLGKEPGLPGLRVWRSALNEGSRGGRSGQMGSARDAQGSVCGPRHSSLCKTSHCHH